VLLVGGAYPGKPLAIATQKIDAGGPIPLETIPYLDDVSVSRDGTRIAGIDAHYQMELFDLTGKRLSGLVAPSNGYPVAWNKTGDLYYLVHSDSNFQIDRLNLTTGKSEGWKAISIGDTPSFAGLAGVAVAPEADAYVYSIHLNQSQLFLVRGWS
jgi:hypothetical protein